MKETFWQKIKKVRWNDIGHIFLYMIAIIPAFFYRLHRPGIWLICETREEARDNGYWLFKYLREAQPQVDSVYAIDRRAKDAQKVSALGPTVNYGSLKHWIFYLTAEVNISTQKSGKPNAAVCYMLEVVLRILRNRRVFLQHGVISNDLPFLYYDKTRFSMFICSARAEYDFVEKRFGYPPGVLKLIGLCRFDALSSFGSNRDIILILPTWRAWLEHGVSANEFMQSEYYIRWSELIFSQKFGELLKKYGKRAVFCTHRNMQGFEELFYSDDPNVEIVRWSESDIQRLIKQCGTLITDFSSVFMDFAYMRKPLLYYHFDSERFRSEHLPRGYFDFENDGFGTVCETLDSLFRGIEELFKTDCEIKAVYRKRADDFFGFADNKNCERTYLEIKEMLVENGQSQV